jgi:hypothetical protein
MGGRNNGNTQRKSGGQRRRARRAGTLPAGLPAREKGTKPRPKSAEPTVTATRTCEGVNSEPCTAQILLLDGYRRCKSCQTAWLGSAAS